jgi:sigma-B regulation protein RsbU (phosphoserine phosphatase)
MRILIADDDDVSRYMLEVMLTKRGHDVVGAANGEEALRILTGPNAPKLAVLDWLMPGLDGVEVCRRVRDLPGFKTVYLILLTVRGAKEHLVAGLRAGANDYITKPFDWEELDARVNVGKQVLALQDELCARVKELETALGRVNQLQSLLPICAYCKSIRDDQNYWHQVETYFHAHNDVNFSHGICPTCWVKTVQPECAKLGIAIPDRPFTPCPAPIRDA